MMLRKDVIITISSYRLMQNRVSAFRFRIKRKEEFETLKDQVDSLIEENEALKS